MTRGGEHHVRVSGQLLDDLLGLQVPDVDHVVLTPRDNPFAPRHGKVGKHTILFVLVSSVGLQTFAL